MNERDPGSGKRAVRCTGTFQTPTVGGDLLWSIGPAVEALLTYIFIPQPVGPTEFAKHCFRTIGDPRLIRAGCVIIGLCAQHCRAAQAPHSHGCARR